MSASTRIKALLGQCKLYLALGVRELALACFLEAERLLPHVRGAQTYLNLVLQTQRLERYVLLPNP